MSLLGLDVGTTGCKAAVYGLAGTTLGTSYREYDLIHPGPGLAELDANAVWGSVAEVIAEAAAGSQSDPVTALSISAMGEAFVPVTANGTVLARSIVANVDTRGPEYIERVSNSIGSTVWYSINPNIFTPAYTLPKLCWLRDHDPDLYSETDLFLCWPDFIQLKLGANPSINFSHANRTLMFDIRREEWSSRVIDAAGIDPDKLPPVVASGTDVGSVSADIASKLGLPPGVKVIAGAHDQCCNALGAGVFDQGRAVCGIGTVECITPTYGELPDLDRLHDVGLNAEHHIVADRYVSFIYNQAGSLVKWYRDTMSANEDYDTLFAEMPRDPTRLLVLPYFEMTGAPTYVSDASGAIIGLKTSTTRGEILKAILECETFYFADAMTLLVDLGIDTSELIATGGGAQSDAWLQIKSDILGIPIHRPEVSEAGTLGAAMNAGLATGVFATPSEAAEHYIRPDATFEPRKHITDFYLERLDAYRELYPTLRPLL